MGCRKRIKMAGSLLCQHSCVRLCNSNGETGEGGHWKDHRMNIFGSRKLAIFVFNSEIENWSDEKCIWSSKHLPFHEENTRDSDIQILHKTWHLLCLATQTSTAYSKEPLLSGFTVSFIFKCGIQSIGMGNVETGRRVLTSCLKSSCLYKQPSISQPLPRQNKYVFLFHLQFLGETMHFSLLLFCIWGRFWGVTGVEWV